MGNNLLVTILGFDFNSIWWGITYGMYWLINAIQNAFWILAGVTDVNAGKEPNQGTDGSPTDILSYLFQSTSVQNAFLWFLIVGGTITVISVAIGMIKAAFQDNDGVTSRWKILEKSIEALVITLLMPLIMYVCVAITGLFMQWIISVMNYALGSESTTIADQLHVICLNTSEENLKQLIQQGHSNIKSWSVSFDELKSAGLSDGYQYFTAMIASGILIYVLIAVCTSLVERLIEVVFLYIVSPIVLARTPLDDGGSFKIWKDMVITKLLSVGGVIICMYIYFILLQNVNTWFDTSNDESAVKIGKDIAKIMIIIGGAFAVKKGSLLVGQLVSQNAGINEGMGQAQSLHMLSSGLRIGAGAIKAGFAGGVMASKGFGTGASGLASGVSGGSGNVTNLARATAGTGRANILGGAGGDAIGNAYNASTAAKSAVNAPVTAASGLTTSAGGDGIGNAYNAANGGVLTGEKAKRARNGTGIGGAILNYGLIGAAGYGLAKGAKALISGTGKLIKGTGKAIGSGMNAVTNGGFSYTGEKIKQFGQSTAHKANLVGKARERKLLSGAYETKQKSLQAKIESTNARVAARNSNLAAGSPQLVRLQTAANINNMNRLNKLEKEVKKANTYHNNSGRFGSTTDKFGTTQSQPEAKPTTTDSGGAGDSNKE